MEKEIAIIIPVYNGELFIQKILLSIDLQTIKNKCKIIIINDGDQCKYNILSQFNELDICFFKLEKNLGPGEARNKGIEIAVQEEIPYIVFADQDDEFYGQYALEFLLTTIKRTSADLVRSPIITEAFDQIFFYEQNGNLLFGKIYKTEIIKNNNIKFFPLHYEDGCFNLTYIINSDLNIFDFPYPIYLWKDNSKSICRKNNGIFCQTTFIPDFINLINTYEQLLIQNKNKQIILNTIPERLIYFYNIYKQWEQNLTNIINYERRKQLSQYFYKLVEYFPVLENEDWWRQYISDPSLHEFYIFYTRGIYE